METNLPISNYSQKAINKLTLVFLFVILFGKMGFSQQVPLYSQYCFNPFIYNPAMTGTGENTNAFLIHRSQWTGMPGAPLTSALTIDGPVKGKNTGLGLSLTDDIKGITERMAAHVSYSYHVNFSEKSMLLFGLSLGIVDNRVDFSKAIVKTQSDPFLFTGNQRKTTMDANAGLAYMLGNLEVGVAVPQLMGNTIKYVNTDDSRIYYGFSRHYLGTLKYTFNINKEKNISCYPLVLVRAVPEAPIQYDVNAVLNWQDKGWISASYRSNYAIGVNAGIRLSNRLVLGYAYDIITGSIGTSAGASHEIMFGYTFGQSKKSADEIAILKYEQEMNTVDSLTDEELFELLNKLKEYEKTLDEKEADIVQLIDAYFESTKTNKSEENIAAIDHIKKELLDYINKKGMINLKELNRLIEEEKLKQAEELK